MVNCLVRPEVYERHRAVVRADPLVLVHGRLERRERNMNVLVTALERIDPPAEGADLDDAAEMARVRAAAPRRRAWTGPAPATGVPARDWRRGVRCPPPPDRLRTPPSCAASRRTPRLPRTRATATSARTTTSSSPGPGSTARPRSRRSSTSRAT